MTLLDLLSGQGLTPNQLALFHPGGFLGQAGKLKQFAGSKEGSLVSGRAILQGGARDQDMEGARTFDVFGSPATAGNWMQPWARAGALAYGAGAGLGAMFGGSSGGAYAAGPYGGFDSAAIGATNYGAGAAGTGGGMGKYLQMANLGMGLMGPRGGGQQPQSVSGPRPRPQPQPRPFSSNSPYVRMLAMRGLLRQQ